MDHDLLDWAQLVFAVAAFVGAVGGLVISLANAMRLVMVKELVNGQSEKLNKLTETESYARGLLEGTAARPPEAARHVVGSTYPGGAPTI